ncbi:hypothetical protein P9112_007388 [Eukaryota sp. TZLM1-RC]
MSDIVLDSEIISTLPILLTSCSETRKRITRLRARVPTSSFHLFFIEQQSTSSRTPQSGTVILLYRNKRKVSVSIFYRNRRSDPSVGVEYYTFFSLHVGHDMGAIELAIVIIILGYGMFFFVFCFES